ncbi:glycosyltransferase 52 family protein [Vibrio alginolyticus]
MNLFSVTSPFQYICALEAKAHYKTSNNILLLVEQTSELGLNQQNKLVDEKEWDYVIKIPRKDRTRNLPKAIKSIRGITSGKKIEHFFHAEYHGWRSKLLLRNLHIDKEVYFDDGTLTINEYEEEIRPKNIYRRKRIFNDLLLTLQGIKPIGELTQSKNLELFTIFDIVQPEHPIIKNNLSELVKRYKKPRLFSESGAAGFIGQGAVGHKNQKSELEYLSEVNAFCKIHDSVVYFPHRTESDDIRSKIECISNLKYHKSEYPLEIEIFEKNIILSKLVGTNSTVLFSAKIIFPEMKVSFIQTNVDNYSEKNKLRNNRIVTYLEKAKINKINLDTKQ